MFQGLGGECSRAPFHARRAVYRMQHLHTLHTLHTASAIPALAALRPPDPMY